MAQALVSFSTQRQAFALESAGGDSEYARFSILGFDPTDRVIVAQDQGPPGWDHLGIAFDRCRDRVDTGGLPFVGGWVGYLGYEFGLPDVQVAPVAENDVALPAARFDFYNAVAVYDHARRRWFAAGVGWPTTDRDAHQTLSARLDAVERQLLRAEHLRPQQCRVPTTSVCAAGPTSDMPLDDYRAAVRRALRYISAGDVYQVNLTQRFSTETDVDALELYLRLRAANPAGYAALLRYEHASILSSSPELFLEARRGHVVTRPIKGTRPRHGDAVLDAVRRNELLGSEKDHAELAMIVDLMRNDLGRVCRFGTIRVDRAAECETHPTVHHLVATVRGRLRSDVTPLELLRAAYPGGSITGAPKIRAMQIISEVEVTRRGPYCGCIGYVGFGGDLCFNIAIRTMILDRRRLHLHAGGAIVADSTAAAEYEETLAKARGMLRALGHDSAARNRTGYERAWA